MLFGDIVGQARVKDRLVKSVQEGRISHAQLFSGPEGCGKMALALAYARYIACSNRNGNDSCGNCPSCRKFSKLVHPDLHFVFPVFRPKDSKKTVTSDDFLPEWRSMVLASPYFSLNTWISLINAENAQVTIYANESDSIIRKLSFKSCEAEYKTMIIWLPEKMNLSCANKLLKMIEEPPVKTLFLLVTEEEGGILPTIRSRTQIVRIPPLSPGEMKEALEKQGQHTPETLEEIVHMAKGNFLKATAALNSGEETASHLINFQKIMRFAWKGNRVELIDLAEEMATLGREYQKDFLSYGLELTRNFFVMNMGKPELLYLSAEEKDWGTRFAPFINEKNIIPLRQAFEEGVFHISMNGNPRIVFTDLFLQIVRLIRK